MTAGVRSDDMQGKSWALQQDLQGRWVWGWCKEAAGGRTAEKVLGSVIRCGMGEEVKRCRIPKSLQDGIISFHFACLQGVHPKLCSFPAPFTVTAENH